MYSFVLMPFDKEFDDVYQLGILEAAKQSSVEAQRLDKQIFVSDMLAKIYAEIDRSDFVIADMSTRNPNVFYEVGYADAKKKPVILLTNNADDIPFDLRHRPHIVYGSISQLKVDLVERLQWIQKEVGKISSEPLKSVVNVVSTEVDRTEYTDTGELRLRIEVHNRIARISERINSIYLYTAKGWTIHYEDKECNRTPSPDDNNPERHIVHPSFSVIPASDWLPVDLLMKKRLFTNWDEDQHRSDSYKNEGLLRIAINTESQKNINDHLVSVIFEYNDFPF
jgi:hypothetical protein